MASTVDHIDGVDEDSLGAKEPWRVVVATELDVDKKESPTDWTCGSVLDAHERRVEGVDDSPLKRGDT